MGSVVKNVTKSVKKAVSSAADIVTNTAKGDFSEALDSTGDFFKSSLAATTGYSGAKGAIKDTTEFLADATGATAAQKQLEQQAELSKREARRQALLSDAMARNQGGDAARVITGGRGKNNRSGGRSTSGKSGTQTSGRTGVQS